MKHRWPYLLVFALVAAWVYHASSPGKRVEGCYTGCSPATDVDVHQIRVISLNMLHGFPSFDYLPQRLERIAAEITRQQADIVLMVTLEPGFMGQGSFYEKTDSFENK